MLLANNRALCCRCRCNCRPFGQPARREKPLDQVAEAANLTGPLTATCESSLTLTDVGLVVVVGVVVAAVAVWPPLEGSKVIILFPLAKRPDILRETEGPACLEWPAIQAASQQERADAARINLARYFGRLDDTRETKMTRRVYQSRRPHWSSWLPSRLPACLASPELGRPRQSCQLNPAPSMANEVWQRWRHATRRKWSRGPPWAPSDTLGASQ